MTEIIQRAIADAGSQPKLARASGLSQQQISKLLNGQRKISADVALAISRATEGRIRISEMRPDLADAVLSEATSKVVAEASTSSPAQ